MDSKNFVIGILSTTAAILLVGVLIIHSRPMPAVASGVTATAGDYVVTVGSITMNDEELVYVIDAPAERMIMYRFDIGKGEIRVASSIDLAQMRAAAGEKTAQPTTKKPTPTKKRKGRP